VGGRTNKLHVIKPDRAGNVVDTVSLESVKDIFSVRSYKDKGLIVCDINNGLVVVIPHFDEAAQD
jgi:hypothetical protein